MNDPFIDIELEIVMRAAVLVGDDVTKARSWFSTARLRHFEGAAPWQLVELGRGAELLRYLKSLDQLPS